MAIDILSIKPSVISRDLKGKYVLLYGKPKAGKTTAACQFPKHLLLAFERGYNAVGNAMAQDINSWSDFKMVLRQLAKPEAKEKFETIIIDTVTIAWELCEKFICTQNSVAKISDIAWGQGYSACKKEFEESLRRITQMGYGLVLIAHDSTHIEKTADGNEIEVIAPELPKRAREICNSLVDIIGFISIENGERWLYTRETPTVFAGSRFKYLPSKIKFGYNELVKAIGEAIDKSAAEGVTVVDKLQEDPKEVLNFNQIRLDAQNLWEKLVKKDESNAIVILSKVEEIFGKPLKLSEITENQVELFNLVLLEMKELDKN